ncbi:hypothetical protein ACFVZ2_28605, partial [Streptomyces lasiicapitis]
GPGARRESGRELMRARGLVDVLIREEFLHEDDYFSGEFQARCLGKVRTWNREAGELTLDAVAIFR